MQRYGKISAGVCVPNARFSSVRKRSAVHIRHLWDRFIGWLTGTGPLADIAHDMSLSRKQL
ncbi:MAG: hypothetical protein WCK32_08655, partial [Chlorobiaceae bacterium]